MTRKITSLLLAALMVLLTAAPALAESILDLPEVIDTTGAISFGVTVRKEPAAETTLEDDRIQQRYVGVTDNDYRAFGVRLGNEGFAIAAQDNQDNVLTVTVTNGELSIELRYDRNIGELTAVYPAGTTFESKLFDPFENYIRIGLGDEINMPGSGRLAFNAFVLHEEGKPFSRIRFELYNTATSSIHARDLLQEMAPTLFYINQDGTYQFDFTSFGMNDTGGVWGDVKSLTKENIGFFTDEIPEGLRDSTDGTIAVTFTLGGQNYVLYYRENGVDLIR